MNAIKLRNPGVAALEITTGSRRVLVDAFNSINPAEKLDAGDILLFTHEDEDHFFVKQIPDIKGTDITIIGPPSITKPLLDSNKVNSEQIMILNSPNNRQPACLDIGDIRIISYSTPHFNGWAPIHNSYLLQIENRNLYITGDGLIKEEYRDFIKNVDVVICNLVDEGYISGREDKRFAIHHHLSYLLNIISYYKPKQVIGVHLIDFAGTVNPTDMKGLADSYGFHEIIVPISPDEIVSLA